LEIQVAIRGCHRGQAEILQSDARFRVASCGRRWGKSILGVAMLMSNAGNGKRGWWVSPTYPMSAIAWRELKRMASKVPGVVTNESERRLTYPGGGTVQVKSADSPAGLRGEGLDYLVIDEAAFIDKWPEVWEQALRPTLSDRCGGALFISTPKGFNHFSELYQNATGPEWARWQFPTWDNPHIAKSEIEAARAMLPALVFRQEYGAEFVQMAGAMFRRDYFRFVDAAPAGLQWVRSWDLAVSTKASADYTAGVRCALADDGTLYIGDVVRGRWEWPDARRIIVDTALSDSCPQGVERVAFQLAAVQELMRERALANTVLRELTPDKDKVARCLPWLARAEQGKVALVRGAWNAAFLDEVCAFPEVPHDDMVDAVSGAVQMLANPAPEPEVAPNVFYL
jgi:predicted phage terminase large subunit-like protein